MHIFPELQSILQSVVQTSAKFAPAEVGAALQECWGDQGGDDGDEQKAAGGAESFARPAPKQVLCGLRGRGWSCEG